MKKILLSAVLVFAFVPSSGWAFAEIAGSFGYRNLSSQAAISGKAFIPQSGARLTLFDRTNIAPELALFGSKATFGGIAVTDWVARAGVRMNTGSSSGAPLLLAGLSGFIARYKGAPQSTEFDKGFYFGVGFQKRWGAVSARMDIADHIRFNFADSNIAMDVSLGVSL